MANVRSEDSPPYGDDDAVIAKALTILRRRLKKPGATLNSPDSAVNYLLLHLSAREREHFGMFFLDARHRVLASEELFVGTVDSCTVNPRELVRRTLEHNAAAVMLYHNHPSGNSEPSQADEILTRRIVETMALVDVRVLDHIIVAGGAHTSFAEKGLL